MAYLFQPTGLTAGTKYRVDTGATNGTAATITRIDPATPIDGSIIQAGSDGKTAAFLGNASALYARPLNYLGTPGTAVALAGSSYPVVQAQLGGSDSLPSSGGTLTGPLTLSDTLDVAGRMRYRGFRVPAFPPSTHTPKQRRASTAFLMQSGHGWAAGGSGTASSSVNDTTTFATGSQSIRVTTNGTGIQSQLRKTGISAMDLTDKALRVRFKIDDVTHLNYVSLYVGTSTLANFFTWKLHTHPTTGSTPWVLSGEWVTVTVGWADVLSASGSYSIDTHGAPSTKTGFTELQFAVYDDAAGPVTYHLQSVEIVPATSTTFPTGVVSFTFDDSWATQYTAGKPILDTYGYPATAYTICDYVDSNASYMTTAQLKALRDYSGWEISGHAYANANHGQTNGFESLTAAQVDEDMFMQRLWLNRNGFKGDNHAYPKGRFALTTDGVSIESIAAQYFSTSRSIINETLEPVPPVMPHRIKSMTGVSEAAGASLQPNTLVGNGKVLDRISRQGGWHIFCLHEVVPDGTATSTTQITVSGLTTLCSNINSLGIPVHTVSEVLRYFS